MARITGKWEYEVDPERVEAALEWVRAMKRKFLMDDMVLNELHGSPASNGYLLDDSVGGVLDPFTGTITVFYSEEQNVSFLAEELGHYFQYKEQGLLGTKEAEIGVARIDANEKQMHRIMLANGFRSRR